MFEQPHWCGARGYACVRADGVERSGQSRHRASTIAYQFLQPFGPDAIAHRPKLDRNDETRPEGGAVPRPWFARRRVRVVNCIGSRSGPDAFFPVGGPGGADVDRDHCFRVVVEQGGQEPVLRLVGELDLAAASKLRACLAQFSGHFIALDFSDVTFMDSTIIAVIVAAYQRAKVARGELNLRNVPLAQRHVLDMTGLSTLLGLEANDRSAP